MSGEKHTLHGGVFKGRKGLHRRLYAIIMARGMDGYNRMVDDRKRALLGRLSGTVLEIGPGTGTNLRYYAPGIRWIGIEPMLAMHPYLQREADRLNFPIQIRAGLAETITAEDNSVDAVVSTLVMCSVADPGRVLSEIRRILKPGGKFIFMEHVAAPRGSRLRLMQNLIAPVWRMVSDGCHPNRETWAMIQESGFSEVNLEHFRLPMGAAGPHIAGVAIKGASNTDLSPATK